MVLVLRPTVVRATSVPGMYSVPEEDRSRGSSGESENAAMEGCR